MWFRTPQCSGHTKGLGEFFWQSPGNARSLVGTRGVSRESQLERLSGSAWGVLPHPFRTFQLGVTGLKRSPSTAGVPLKLTGTGERSAVPPSCPGGGFCSAECLANLTPVWKAANNLTKVFSAVFFFSSCCIKLGKSWFSNNSKSQFQLWNAVPFIL